MKFEQNIRFSSLQNEANKTHEDMLKRLDSLETVLDGRLDGRSDSSIARGIVLSAVYMIGVIPLCLLIGGTRPINLVTMIAFVLFFGAMLLGNVFERKHYGVFLQFRKQLNELRSRVMTGKNSLVSKRDLYMSCGGNGWELTFETTDSVCVSAADMESQLQNIEYIGGGLLGNVRTVLFYVAGVLWTATGSLAFVDMTASAIYGLTDIFSYNTITVILNICVLVACVIDCFALKICWSHTGCKVNNGSALAVLFGPLLYFALVCAICLVVGAVVLVLILIEIALAIAAALFAAGIMISIASASLSGG